MLLKSPQIQKKASNTAITEKKGKTINVTYNRIK